ncbi:hypothetical protein LCGC14_0221540 [marine sediment metagenome]|uniref:Uncharacterized protein n=1 Tax=marine sediment metagenome TaxID=412755 RepID=A0A0F9WXZ7_9ZZZZ
MSVLINLIGKRFGRLVVIKRIINNNGKNAKWLCICDCGNETSVLSSHLIRNNIKSCGCLQREMTSVKNTKHGHLKNGRVSTIYRSWTNMKTRCVNRKYNEYESYGGRGITVCKRWLKFKNFNYDMGKRWKPGLQIDRINNDKGYCKENCRWVTSKINNRNKRKNLYKTHRGKTKLVIEWAKEHDIPYKTLWARLYRYGWSTEKALTTP